MVAKLSLTAADSALVDQIFKRNDPQNFGVITGDVAVSVFSGSNLPSTTLGEIWALSDSDNKGFLDKNGVGAAVRLIGHAQAGKTVSENLLSQRSCSPHLSPRRALTLFFRLPTLAGPPAAIDSYSHAPSSQRARSPAPRPHADAGLPPLTPADKTKFLRLFQGCGPVKGLLPGL
jgi:epidermal growth factor receptor substrate 15